MIRAEYSERRPPNLRGVFSMGSYLVEKSIVLQNKRIVSEDSASDIPILMMHGELLLTSTDAHNENNANYLQ